MRDSGIIRFLMDAPVPLGVPSIMEQYPTAMYDFLRMSGQIRLAENLATRSVIARGESSNEIRWDRLSYGAHGKQIVDVMNPNAEQKDSSRPLIAFVHGGACGSGFPTMYRSIATPFVDSNMTVAIVGYRTYPDADVLGHIEDLYEALSLLMQQYPDSPIYLIGHSTGANLVSNALLKHITKNNPSSSAFNNVSGVIGLAGLYDVPKHYIFERGRGVERLSPLAPAFGGSYPAWKQLSPTRLVHATMRTRHNNNISSDFTSQMPRLLVIHGNEDTVVPFSSSVAYASAWNEVQEGGQKAVVCDLALLEGVGHADCVTDLMFGGPTRDIVMDWIQQQPENR